MSRNRISDSIRGDRFDRRMTHAVAVLTILVGAGYARNHLFSGSDGYGTMTVSVADRPAWQGFPALARLEKPGLEIEENMRNPHAGFNLTGRQEQIVAALPEAAKELKQQNSLDYTNGRAAIIRGAEAVIKLPYLDRQSAEASVNAAIDIVRGRGYDGPLATDLCRILNTPVRYGRSAHNYFCPN